MRTPARSILLLVAAAAVACTKAETPEAGPGAGPATRIAALSNAYASLVAAEAGAPADVEAASSAMLSALTDADAQAIVQAYVQAVEHAQYLSASSWAPPPALDTARAHLARVSYVGAAANPTAAVSAAVSSGVSRQALAVGLTPACSPSCSVQAMRAVLAEQVANDAVAAAFNALSADLVGVVLGAPVAAAAKACLVDGSCNRQTLGLIALEVFGTMAVPQLKLVFAVYSAVELAMATADAAQSFMTDCTIYQHSEECCLPENGFELCAGGCRRTATYQYDPRNCGACAASCDEPDTCASGTSVLRHGPPSCTAGACDTSRSTVTCAGDRVCRALEGGAECVDPCLDACTTPVPPAYCAGDVLAIPERTCTTGVCGTAEQLVDCRDLGMVCRNAGCCNPLEPACAGMFNGTYRSTRRMEAFTHVDTSTVSGWTAIGYHSFTDGVASGSFSWTARLTRSGTPSRVNLSGSGTINNTGTRSFTLTGAVELRSDGSAELWWSGNDPMYGPIGGVSVRPPR
jgi:hypothetical protein